MPFVIGRLRNSAAVGCYLDFHKSSRDRVAWRGHESHPSSQPHAHPIQGNLMKLKLVLPFAFAFGLSAHLCAASSVQVKVENKCGSPTAYTLQKKGSSLNTSLSPRASTTHSLDVGDKISVGKNVIHTVSTSSSGQPVIVCNK